MGWNHRFGQNADGLRTAESILRGAVFAQPGDEDRMSMRAASSPVDMTADPMRHDNLKANVHRMFTLRPHHLSSAANHKPKGFLC